MSRSRSASTGPEPAAQPVSYTALVDDGASPRLVLRQRGRQPGRAAGLHATDHTSRSPRRKTREAPMELPARFPALTRRTDFWRMRLTLWVADAVIAAVGSLAAIMLERTGVHGGPGLVAADDRRSGKQRRPDRRPQRPAAIRQGKHELRPADDPRRHHLQRRSGGTRMVLACPLPWPPAASLIAGCSDCGISGVGSVSTSARAW